LPRKQNIKGVIKKEVVAICIAMASFFKK